MPSLTYLPTASAQLAVARRAAPRERRSRIGADGGARPRLRAGCAPQHPTGLDLHTRPRPRTQASRLLAQLLVSGGAAVFRAATQAWQQALVSERPPLPCRALRQPGAPGAGGRRYLLQPCTGHCACSAPEPARGVEPDRAAARGSDEAASQGAVLATPHQLCPCALTACCCCRRRRATQTRRRAAWRRRASRPSPSMPASCRCRRRR